MKLSTLLKAYAKEAKKSKQIANKLDRQNRLAWLKQRIRDGQEILANVKKKIIEHEQRGDKFATAFYKGVYRVLTLIVYLMLKATLIAIDAERNLRYLTQKLSIVKKKRSQLTNKYKQELKRIQTNWKKIQDEILNKENLEKTIDLRNDKEAQRAFDDLTVQLLSYGRTVKYLEEQIADLDQMTSERINGILSYVSMFASKLEDLASKIDIMKENIREGIKVRY